MIFNNTNFHHRYLLVNKIRIHIVEYAESKNEIHNNPTPFLLLHGFPENWYSWRYLMPLLSQGSKNNNFKVFAIDLRGFNRSDKPTGWQHYHLSIIIQDIIQIIQKISPIKQVFLVGHDWGGGVAWEVARYFPEYVKNLFILNCPPVEVLFKTVLKDMRQFLKSYYVFLFQIPFLAERIIYHKQCKYIKDFYEKVWTSNHIPLSSNDVEYYTCAFNQKGGANGINFYRAAFWDVLTQRITMHPPIVKIPTKVIWGVNDIALSIELTYNFKELIENGKFKIKYITKGTHNIQQNFPDICAQEILKEIN